MCVSALGGWKEGGWDCYKVPLKDIWICLACQVDVPSCWERRSSWSFQSLQHWERDTPGYHSNSCEAHKCIKKSITICTETTKNLKLCVKQLVKVHYTYSISSRWLSCKWMEKARWHRIPNLLVLVVDFLFRQRCFRMLLKVVANPAKCVQLLGTTWWHGALLTERKAFNNTIWINVQLVAQVLFCSCVSPTISKMQYDKDDKSTTEGLHCPEFALDFAWM